MGKNFLIPGGLKKGSVFYIGIITNVLYVVNQRENYMYTISSIIT